MRARVGCDTGRLSEQLCASLLFRTIALTHTMRYSILVALGAVCAGTLLSAEAMTTEPLVDAVPPVKEAMDLVLDEKDQHVDVETRYVNQDQLLQEMGERLVQDGRERVIKMAETKYVKSIALEIKACKTKHVVDERAQQACINKIRDDVLGPMPTRDDVDPTVNEKSKLDEILARHPVQTDFITSRPLGSILIHCPRVNHR